MAEYVGAGPFYPDAGTAGVGALNKAIKDTAGGANGTTKQTSQNPATWQLFQPTSTSSGVTGGTGGSPSPTTGNNKGFNYLVADFDATAAAPGGLPAGRVLLATTVTVAFTVGYSGINTANIYAALFYHRTAAGTLTYLTGGVSTSQASGFPNISFTVALPRTTFAAGESLHVEYWVKANDVVAGSVHQTVTFNTGSGNTINPTLGYEYERSHALSGTGSNALVRSLGKPQAVTGTGSVAALTRSLARVYAITGTGSIATMRRAIGRPYAVGGTGTVALSRSVGKPLAVTGTGSTTLGPRVIGVVKAITGTGSIVTMRRAITRSLSVTGTGVALLTGKALVAARGFAVTGTGSVSLRLDMAQSVLNRLAGGAAAVRKIFVNIFDD